MRNSEFLTMAAIFLVIATIVYFVGAHVLFKFRRRKAVLLYLIASWLLMILSAGCLLTPFMVPFVVPRGLPLADFYIPFVWIAGMCWVGSMCFLIAAIAKHTKAAGNEETSPN